VSCCVFVFVCLILALVVEVKSVLCAALYSCALGSAVHPVASLYFRVYVAVMSSFITLYLLHL
jgi:hypothetical protein